jgi:segregation and condensation protein A
MNAPEDDTVNDVLGDNDDGPVVPAVAPERPSRGSPETWNLDALPPELDYFRSSAAYQIELTGFQGPLDLLLFLIDKDQVDIYDIPIARITEQFIRHIEVMQSISLDQAGEFIAMAATLLVIKMKMLMPSRLDVEDDQEEDPRAELVRRLLEYKRFKEAALAFQGKEDERRLYHTRQLRFPFANDLAVEPALRIEMFDLLAALAGIYDRVRKRPVHDIVREPFTVGEKIALIANRTGDGSLVRFEELFAGDSIKMEVVVTFIAILEMVKRGRLVFVQTEPLGPIWLQRPAGGAITDADDGDETLETTMAYETALANALEADALESSALGLSSLAVETETGTRGTDPANAKDEDDEDEDADWVDDDDDDDDDDDVEWDDDDEGDDDAEVEDSAKASADTSVVEVETAAAGGDEDDDAAAWEDDDDDDDDDEDDDDDDIEWEDDDDDDAEVKEPESKREREMES